LPFISSIGQEHPQNNLSSPLDIKLTPHKHKQSCESQLMLNKNLINLELNSTDNFKYLSVPELQYTVSKQLPHDTNAYTEGLVFQADYLYESTGIVGFSRLNKINSNNGLIVAQGLTPKNIFAEGLTILNDNLYQFSYKKNIVNIYPIKNLEKLSQIHYDKDAWGVAAIDKQHLLVSDGSSQLHWFDPKEQIIVKSAQVHYQKYLVEGLNELEIINGKILANIWPTQCIAVINSDRLEVESWINLSQLNDLNINENSYVTTNGIAYDDVHHELIVTGKYWQSFYFLKFSQSDSFMNATNNKNREK